MLHEHADTRPPDVVDEEGSVAAMAVTMKPNLDWMRDPIPPDLTPFQKFFRSVKWEESSIGPMASWSRELKQTIRMMIADGSPQVLYWGEAFTVIYNEAYTPLVGNKHPSILGKDAYQVFPNFWAYFDKLITEQRSTGEFLQGNAEMLLMERHGFLEETYFDWKLTPIIGDDGEVKGSYGSPTDMTKEIITRRRIDCVKHLAHMAAKCKSLKELSAATVSGLGANDKDAPFVLLYSVKEQISLAAPPSRPNYICRLEDSFGVESCHYLAKEYLDAQYDVDGLAPRVLEAFTSDEPLVLEAADPQLASLLDGINWKGHGSPSHQLAVLPLRSEDDIVSLFIIGLNPYRRYNEMYRSFLQSITEVLGPQVSRIKLSEEVQRRVEVAEKATSDFEKSEERFTRFAERSTIGLAVAGVDGQIMYANDAWYKFAGLDPHRTDYDGWLENVIIDDLPLVREWWERVQTEKKGGQFQIRSKLPFRQGHMYSANKTALCAVYPDLNEAQEIESVMGLVIDISELKWIEDQLTSRSKALEESEGKWKNYAEHCPLGIVRTDGEGHVLYGNDAWHAYYGFTRSQVPGPQPWLPHIDEGCLEKWQECFESFQQHPGPRAIELKLKNRVHTVKDGDHVITNGVYILVTGFSEFKKDGTVDYIDFWVTDISPQKMAAKILADKVDEAVRLKTHQERFIDMISHEIRNPLSAVLHCGEEVIQAMKASLGKIESVCSDTSRDSFQDRKDFTQQLQNALEAANTIMYCCQHQKQIVDDVLTLSKLDAELLVVSPVPIQPMVSCSIGNGKMLW